MDGNGAYVYLDPYEGGKIVVTEAARNLACTGAVPLGATDNLNYGNPNNPELFWQLKESVRGLADACKAFNAPITGGNCSLYNQSPNGPIDPTPTVAMVGIIEKPEHVTTQWFKDEGDAIVLLGDIVDKNDPLLGLGGSAYLQAIHGQKNGTPPRCDLEPARTLHTTLLGLIQSGLVKSAHDCSEGGLAVCLAESCISRLIAHETPKLIGAQIDLSSVGRAASRADRAGGRWLVRSLAPPVGRAAFWRNAKPHCRHLPAAGRGEGGRARQVDGRFSRADWQGWRRPTGRQNRRWRVQRAGGRAS